MTQPRCDQCRWWEFNGISVDESTCEGECKRFPPTPTGRIAEEWQSLESNSPTTTSDNWCGEFQPNDLTATPDTL
jgi:hypothetical protein